jgi:hypothetical protein
MRRQMMSVKKTMIKGVTSIAMVSAIVFALSLRAAAVEAPKLSEGHKPIVPGARPTPELSATLSDLIRRPRNGPQR